MNIKETKTEPKNSLYNHTGDIFVVIIDDPLNKDPTVWKNNCDKLGVPIDTTCCGNLLTPCQYFFSFYDAPRTILEWKGENLHEQLVGCASLICNFYQNNCVRGAKEILIVSRGPVESWFVLQKCVQLLTEKGHSIQITALPYIELPIVDAETLTPIGDREHILVDVYDETWGHWKLNPGTKSMIIFLDGGVDSIPSTAIDDETRLFVVSQFEEKNTIFTITQRKKTSCF